MFKKIMFALFALCLVVSSAEALLKVGILGAGYNYSGSTVTGYGLEIEAPILPLPLITSRLEVAYVPGSNYSLMPVLITGSYQFPMLPVYAGAGAGVVLYRRTDINIAAPTALNYNFFVGYEQSFMPMSSYFIQAGYEVMKMDNPAPGGGSVDFTGVSVKGGVRIGI